MYSSGQQITCPAIDVFFNVQLTGELFEIFADFICAHWDIAQLKPSPGSPTLPCPLPLVVGRSGGMGEISPYNEIGNLKLCPRDEGFPVVRDLGQVRYIWARFLALAALLPGARLEVGNTDPVSHHK